jgi:hypothetical protein
MSRIGRSKQDIKVKTNKKNQMRNFNKQNINLLNTICTNHSLGELKSLRSAKLIDYNGKITELPYAKLMGNMRASVLVFESAQLHFNPESQVIYDLVTIQNEKKAKDKKKYEDDILQTKDRIDILKKSETKLDDVLGTGTDDVHNKMMEMIQLKEEEDEPMPAPEARTTPPSVAPIPSEIEAILEPIPEPISETVVPLQPELTQDVGKSFSEAEPIARTMPKKIIGNKYHRKFLKDITNRFAMDQYIQYKYLELKVDSSYMIIENPGVFRLNVTTDSVYIMIVGDLQLKRDVLKQIDPNYGAMDVLKDQEEFMQQIQTNEVQPPEEKMPEEKMPDLVPIPHTNDNFPAHFKPGVITENEKSDSDSEEDVRTSMPDTFEVVITDTNDNATFLSNLTS